MMSLEMNTEPDQGTEGRVDVDAGIRAGRRLYWIGGMGYKPKACESC